MMLKSTPELSQVYSMIRIKKHLLTVIDFCAYLNSCGGHYPIPYTVYVYVQ